MTPTVKNEKNYLRLRFTYYAKTHNTPLDLVFIVYKDWINSENPEPITPENTFGVNLKQLLKEISE